MKYYFVFFIFFTFFTSVTAQEKLSKLDSIETQKLFQKLLDSSNNFYNNGEHNKSLELNLEILNKAAKTKNPYYIHQAYRYLAYDYLFLNDSILTMDSFKKSENYAKLSKNDTATALTYMDLANVYSKGLNFNKSFIYHNRAINLFEKIKDSAGMAKAHFNTAISALEANEYNRAYIHILKAKQLNKFGEHKSFLINLNYFLGEYYVYKKNFKKADSVFLKSIEDAKKEKLNTELEYSYYSYSTSLFEQKKYKEAYEVFQKYDEYSDLNSTIFTSSDNKALAQKYQLEEYRKDIEAIKTNNKLQAEIVKSKSRINIILIIVSVVFLILLVALYSASIKRKKLVKILRIKNKEALKAKEQSERLSKAKVKFFSTVSHELRTPLYGVIGLSSILLEDKSLTKHRKDLKFLKFSADYLLALINDVLQINKIDAQTAKDEQTAFNIKDLIETITSSFEYMRIQNNNRLFIEVSENIPELLHGNTVRLSQILMNLIGNACKFTENGTIKITAREVLSNSDDSLTKIIFTIKDTGIGIAKEKQESIFDEFSQIDTHSYSNSGSGLGLPIVKRLLALSNSEISLKSELGKGSSFSFTISFKILKETITKASKTFLDPAILKNKKVLIVEDNKINQIVTRKVLEQKGIICSIAENGEEAIAKIKNNDYDLVLMDINMPVKNGIEASKEVRTFNKTIPIIALTAVEIKEMKNNIYLAGINDIIVKPYDITKFTNCIIKNIGNK